MTVSIAASHGVGRAASHPRTRCAVRPPTTSTSKVPVEIDDPRDQKCGVLGVGCQKRRLIDPQRCGSAEAGQVIDPRLAVVAHRGHRRVPAHPERAGHLGDRPAELTDQAAHLGPGPLG